MEAKAKHTFKAIQREDLGFEKGDTLNVLDMEQDKNWYKAELNGQEGWIPNTYIEMEPHDWFHGKITRIQAEDLLMGDTLPNGAFIVRESESSPGEFSLSVRFCNKVQHFKVFRDGDRKYYLWSTKKFDSLNEMLRWHRQQSVSRSQEILLRDLGDAEETVDGMYDFVAQEDGEVSFMKGDRLIVLDDSDANWWRGRVQRTCEEGMFPANYVRKTSTNRNAFGQTRQ